MSNAASVALTGRSCLAGFVFILVSASLAEAVYGPRTSIGTSYQQTSTTQSLDGINEGNCIASSTCSVLFQRAPQQKGLIVQHVSCSVSVSAGGLRNGFLQTRKGQVFPFRFTQLTPVPTTGTWWTVNSPVMHLVESKEYPRVGFSSSANADWYIVCSISGQLKQP